jgi:type II secretory pathway component PulJ
MADIKDWFIIKESVFWRFKSIDRPLPFLDFLRNNNKELQNLLDKNRLSVVDISGNEIDKEKWEFLILSDYTEEKDTDKIALKATLRTKQNQQQQHQESAKKTSQYLHWLKKEHSLHENEKNCKILQRKIKNTEQEYDKINTKIDALAKEIKKLTTKIKE